MSTAHEPFDILAELHALSALDGEELRRFEAHVAAGCARCEALMRATEEMLAEAAMGGPAQTPPAGLRDVLLRRAAASRRPGPLRWRRWAIGTAAALPDALGGATLTVMAAPAGPAVKVFAVTLEPKGGVDAPTGPMVLASK